MKQKRTEAYKEGRREYMRLYRLRHPEKVAKAKRETRLRHPETLRAWRKKNKPRWIQANKEKHLVYLAVVTAIRKGFLIKPSHCSKCRKSFAPKNIHGHHEDYSKPLEVIWVCQQCHTEIHRLKDEPPALQEGK